MTTKDSQSVVICLLAVSLIVIVLGVIAAVMTGKPADELTKLFSALLPVLIALKVKKAGQN